MSVSIYYTAQRMQPLTSAELIAVHEAIAQFAVEDQIEEYCRSGQGFNWASFSVYDRLKPTKADVVFEGATKLPDNSEEAMWVGLTHWCNLLAVIRQKLPGTSWQVHVDDHEILWDNGRGAYDLTL